MRIVSVVGARPQFVKLAPVAREFSRRGFDHVVVHTGQHYDAAMSGDFFTDFRLPAPDINLEVGSGTHGEQTAAMLAALEPVIHGAAPDWVLVYGDTNSTLAAALAAVKLAVPVAHLESGLRSFNRLMPEEHNRVLTDHAADLLLAPTPAALDLLGREGLADRAVLVGDVMTDICLEVARQVHDTPPDIDLPSDGFMLATLHRPYNTDDPERLRLIIAALATSPVPILLPVHPRLKTKAATADVDLTSGAIVAMPPLNYPGLVYAASRSLSIITDSGGLQKEAYILGVQCTTVRSETEWRETLTDGWNVLCFDDLEAIPQIALRDRPLESRQPFFGEGHAAEKVADSLLSA